MSTQTKTLFELTAEGWTESPLEMDEMERLAACAAISKRIAAKDRKDPSSVPSTKRTEGELLAVERRFLESIQNPTDPSQRPLTYHLGARGADVIVAGVGALRSFMVPMEKPTTRGPQNALGNVYGLMFCKAALERFILAAPLSTHECLKLEVVDSVVRPIEGA